MTKHEANFGSLEKPHGPVASVLQTSPDTPESEESPDPFLTLSPILLVMFIGWKLHLKQRRQRQRLRWSVDKAVEASVLTERTLLSTSRSLSHSFNYSRIHGSHAQHAFGRVHATQDALRSKDAEQQEAIHGKLKIPENVAELRDLWYTSKADPLWISGLRLRAVIPGRSRFLCAIVAIES